MDKREGTMTGPSDTIENQNFGVSVHLIEELTEALEAVDLIRVRVLVDPLHPADVADLIENLNVEARHAFIDCIKSQIAPEVLSQLQDSIRGEVIHQIGTSELARILSTVEADTGIELIQDLDFDQRQELLNLLTPEKREDLKDVLAFPDDSAGRLMQSHVITVPPHWTIGRVINYLAHLEKIPTVLHTVFVVDSLGRPIGDLSLNKLLCQDRNAPVGNLMNTTLHSISVLMDQEEVANIFRHYALTSAPVVDGEDRVIGMISIDDIVGVLYEEATEDILKLGGVTEDDFHASVLSTALGRIQWLAITFINTLLASSVISNFSQAIMHNVALAILMPIVAAMGGNLGMQAVTVVVRALGTHQIRAGNVVKTCFKEVWVGMVNGLIFAVVLGSIASFWFQDLALGGVLALAMFFNMVWAAFAGATLPLLVTYLGLDPAISSGPILTTTTDVLGFTLFLGLATLLLG
jgi:magnesium transporter